MKLSREDVRGIADYAKIALDAAALDDMCAYMNDAVDMLEPVLAYGDENVEPTYYPLSVPENVMRADEPDDSRALGIDVALANAGQTRGRAFRVPSILGEEE